MFNVLIINVLNIYYSCSGSTLAKPINTADSIVNTIAWMKQTKHSRHIMKMLMMTLSADIENCTATDWAATRKMIHVMATAMACPAIMLAKSRIIRAKGFVKIPTNSITGMMGIGAFNHVGTSGQKISFQ